MNVPISGVLCNNTINMRDKVGRNKNSSQHIALQSANYLRLVPSFNNSSNGEEKVGIMIMDKQQESPQASKEKVSRRF